MARGQAWLEIFFTGSSVKVEKKKWLQISRFTNQTEDGMICILNDGCHSVYGLIKNQAIFEFEKKTSLEYKYLKGANIVVKDAEKCPSLEFCLSIDSFDSDGCGVDVTEDFPFIDGTNERQIKIEAFMCHRKHKVTKPTLQEFNLLAKLTGWPDPDDLWGCSWGCTPMMSQTQSGKDSQSQLNPIATVRQTPSASITTTSSDQNNNSDSQTSRGEGSNNSERHTQNKVTTSDNSESQPSIGEAAIISSHERRTQNQVNVSATSENQSLKHEKVNISSHKSRTQNQVTITDNSEIHPSKGKEKNISFHKSRTQDGLVDNNTQGEEDSNKYDTVCKSRAVDTSSSSSSGESISDDENGDFRRHSQPDKSSMQNNRTRRTRVRSSTSSSSGKESICVNPAEEIDSDLERFIRSGLKVDSESISRSLLIWKSKPNVVLPYSNTVSVASKTVSGGDDLLSQVYLPDALQEDPPLPPQVQPEDVECSKSESEEGLEIHFLLLSEEEEKEERIDKKMDHLDHSEAVVDGNKGVADCDMVSSEDNNEHSDVYLIACEEHPPIEEDDNACSDDRPSDDRPSLPSSTENDLMDQSNDIKELEDGRRESEKMDDETERIDGETERMNAETERIHDVTERMDVDETSDESGSEDEYIGCEHDPKFQCWSCYIASTAFTPLPKLLNELAEQQKQCICSNRK